MAKIKKAQSGMTSKSLKMITPPGKKVVSKKDSSSVVTERNMLDRFIPLENARLTAPKSGTKAQTDSLRRKAIKEGDFTEDKSGFLRPTEKYMKPKRISSGMKKGGKIKKSK